ncbi:hypothetical protein [Blastococcus sp. VKM Ac-2987]|uniref:hypothetical protein n=1 Tax=Blastococcus sp. VKM Ac-2987 TaxID=3004141 RepID=UPI0022AB779B|nr:hypothetical protein [Blastococcus sp. VKM Ac-2987]MCZ2861066.1 hypothetical protein [Blastococcus sp. VKM Ac-2987]
MTIPPGGLPDRTSRASAAVAFCPCPPLLLPAVEGRPAPETRALRSACVDAVTAVVTAAPDVVVVVGAGPAPGERFGAGDGGDLRGYGVDVQLPFDGRLRPGGRRLPPAHTVGGWLLDEVSFGGTRVGVGPADLGQLLRDLPAPVGVLALGDGSARRTVKAPGYLDPAAGPFDAAVATALATGDATALAALDAAEGERLLAAGVPTWRAVGAAFAGRHVTARLRHDEAPFGVGYVVADWVVA